MADINYTYDAYHFDDATGQIQFELNQVRQVVANVVEGLKQWSKECDAAIHKAAQAAEGDSNDEHIQALNDALDVAYFGPPTFPDGDFEEYIENAEGLLSDIDHMAHQLSSERDAWQDEAEQLEDNGLTIEDALTEAEGRMLTDSDSDVLAWLLARLRGRVTDRTLTLVG